MSDGFLALSGLVPFPPLASTAGLGGLNDELIPFPEEPDPFQEGKGRQTTIAAFGSAGSPKAQAFIGKPPEPAPRPTMSVETPPRVRAPRTKIFREKKKK